MKKGLIVLGLVVLAAIVIGSSLAGSYNRLLTQREQVRANFAEVDQLLLRRNDLIPNLVETVRGIAGQEQAVFGQIADARARMAGARSPSERIEAGQAMDSALGRLFVVVENYPQLRSNENFLRLQDELAGTENRLSVGRTRYNETARDYNVMVQRFPTNIIAGLFNFDAEPYYPVAPEARQVPRVDFNNLRPDTATAR
jgi:LemA protein